MLFIVPTPIGNLEDITLRALRVLKEVDLVVAEDTRHSGILLKHFEIHKPLESFHSHSDDRKLEKIISVLKNGKDVALISDAGTPGISDPGFALINRAVAENIPITSLPGPVALITALTSTGFPMDKFTFLGFLPIKKGRQTLFQALIDEKRTVVFYESPHRIVRTLSQLRDALGPTRRAAICRELTKMHEEVRRGTLTELAEHFNKTAPRGEFTVVLAPTGF